MTYDSTEVFGRQMESRGSREVLVASRILEGRKHERFHHAELVGISTPYAQIDGRVIDLSAGGALIEICSGWVPGVGEELSITFHDKKNLWGHACRAVGNIIAVKFPFTFQGVDDILLLEQRGRDIYTSRRP